MMARGPNGVTWLARPSPRGHKKDMESAEILELILDHYQNPRNYGEMEDADVSLQGGNPGCGDIITVYLKFNGDKLESISYTGQGCTISQATASLLTELLPG